MVKEVDFIRLHLGPLAESVQENANAWVTSLGKQTGPNFYLELLSYARFISYKSSLCNLVYILIHFQESC